MTMKSRRQYILAVRETIYGADPTPDSGNAILTSGLAPGFQQGNRVTRDLDSPSLGADQEIATGLYTTVSFNVEIAGAGNAGDAPGWGILLRACGFSETITADTSVTYEPVSDDIESVTIYYYQDGELHKITGARGTVSFNLSKEAIPHMAFVFTGLYHDPTAPASLITPNTSAFVDPLPVTEANTPTYTVAGHPVKAEGFTLDWAGQVVYRNVVNSESVQISGRTPTGTLTFEQERIGAKNFWTAAKGQDLHEVKIVHGTTAGNIVEISSDRVQLSQPALDDSDGISVMNLNMRLIKGDDDELEIVVR